MTTLTIEVPQKDKRHPLVSEEEFVTLLKKAEKDSKHLISMLLSNQTDREDAYHEAVLNAWEYLGSWDPRLGSFTTWFRAIVKNAAWHILRTNKNETQLRRDLYDAIDTGNYWIKGGKKITLK